MTLETSREDLYKDVAYGTTGKFKLSHYMQSQFVCLLRNGLIVY
jgi:hypothetical protein